MPPSPDTLDTRRVRPASERLARCDRRWSPPRQRAGLASGLPGLGSHLCRGWPQHWVSHPKASQSGASPDDFAKQGKVKHNRFFEVIRSQSQPSTWIKSKRGPKNRPRHPACDRPTNAGKGPNPYCSHSWRPLRGVQAATNPPALPQEFPNGSGEARLGGGEGVGTCLLASFDSKTYSFI